MIWHTAIVATFCIIVASGCPASNEPESTTSGAETTTIEPTSPEVESESPEDDLNPTSKVAASTTVGGDKTDESNESETPTSEQPETTTSEQPETPTTEPLPPGTHLYDIRFQYLQIL